MKFSQKDMMHEYLLNACFAWSPYLVHSYTKSILLYLFTQSVGYGCSKRCLYIEDLIMCFPSSSKKESLRFKDVLCHVMFKVL